MQPLILVLAAQAMALVAPFEGVEITTTETVPFVSNGDIELRETSGALNVEGWDRQEVEVTVRRATERRYDSEKQLEMRNELDKVVVTARQDASGRLVIATSKPARRWFQRRADVKLEYTIRAPYHSNLLIRHGSGQVSLVNLAGNTDLISGMGQVNLSLPGNETFLIDARAKIGEVSSDFRCNGPLWEAHRVFVRVGVGDICIRKNDHPQ